jgi:chromosome segregation ATPase
MSQTKNEHKKLKDEVTKNVISLNDILSKLSRQIKSASVKNGQLHYEKTRTVNKIHKLKTTAIDLRGQRKCLDEELVDFDDAAYSWDESR